MDEPAPERPERFSGTADRLTAATILHDRIAGGRLGPDPDAQPPEPGGEELSSALALLLRWTAHDEQPAAES